MGKHLTSHIVLDTLVKLNDLRVLCLLVVDDVALLIALDLGRLVHDRQTVSDLVKELLVRCCRAEYLSQYRHELRRG